MPCEEKLVYSQEELKEAFELVEDKKHWKNPIKSWVPEGTNLDVIHKAIIHFTATVPIIRFKRKIVDGVALDGYSVVAAGYWNGPAA